MTDSRPETPATTAACISWTEQAQSRAVTRRRSWRTCARTRERSESPPAHYALRVGQLRPWASRPGTPHADMDGSGAMDDVNPIFCRPVQYCFAICFHVVVTVAMPDMCASTVILNAFLRLTVFTTLVIAIDT